MNKPQETLKPADPSQETAPNPAVSARDKAVGAIASFLHASDPRAPLNPSSVFNYMERAEGFLVALDFDGLVIVDLSDIQRIIRCWGPTIATAKDFDLHIYERLEAACKSVRESREGTE